MLKINPYVLGMMSTNCYVLYEDTEEPDAEGFRSAVVIDAAAEPERLMDICEKDLRVKPVAILLTHGHYYRVSFTTELLKEDARVRGFQIAMFGHTHKPLVDRSGPVTLINPGSISYPRQDGRRPSYILMEIDREGEAHYTVNYL